MLCYATRFHACCPISPSFLFFENPLPCFFDCVIPSHQPFLVSATMAFLSGTVQGSEFKHWQNNPGEDTSARGVLGELFHPRL